MYIRTYVCDHGTDVNTQLCTVNLLTYVVPQAVYVQCVSKVDKDALTPGFIGDTMTSRETVSNGNKVRNPSHGWTSTVCTQTYVCTYI